MTPQQLKNCILQLAIQGKLVEQRPEEGTAKELLKEISAEKQRLIQEKKQAPPKKSLPSFMLAQSAPIVASDMLSDYRRQLMDYRFNAPWFPL